MASNKIRVALDAMGGDYAPQAVVQGAALAAQEAKKEIDLITPSCDDKAYPLMSTINTVFLMTFNKFLSIFFWVSPFLKSLLLRPKIPNLDSKDHGRTSNL